ncbi:hypothetical protein [Marixanthomonas ophiurae]|uniref:LlaJI family restriction endonuclease n=1 Tax=Marixanthomonas ophiurae TaxID=387659 RepID=A0A3E1QE87_9FLAO|nr:hypothetical protein [Marixanthomonas ophiurae]RFN60376.1 hypothetical protein DZ858_10155 [Marixanthomonas ophiurae]
MKLLIEEQEYPVTKLEPLFDDFKFYKQTGNKGVIKSVGYYHSYKNNELVFMLPKVFMKDGTTTIFDKSTEELYDALKDTSVKHDQDLQWLRELSIYFYNSLIEYNRRWEKNSLLNPSKTFELNTNIGNNNYSYLDIVLAFTNFYKKNKNFILQHHIEQVTNKVTKPKWEKTVRKGLPLMTASGMPVYLGIRNKRKVRNVEEELITYYFSILKKLNQAHQLNLKIDKSYNLITGIKFDRLCANEYGLSKLRKIKYRYFNDTLRRMYQLCELYFTNNSKASSKKDKEEYICVNNYNIIFEDMIDKLFTDKVASDSDIQHLKKNEDGKLIDHIYEDQSIIDNSNIFFIGDSKYYKTDREAGKFSKYKQITYAKNIILYNIELLNDTGQYHNPRVRYRDNLTEGYNITPNFFIYGRIKNESNYNDHQIKVLNEEPECKYHWKHRLFDRDTLFVHQYTINFLFVLKAYTAYTPTSLQKFQLEVKNIFRSGFIDYFNNPQLSQFTFYQSTIAEEQKADYIRDNFKSLNGKCITTVDSRLILAKHAKDDSLTPFLDNFELLENFE